ncbi:MAG: hypothetical protein A3G34_09060 [Candidatus Lindowbacteria bacterium RIFCSPLOWO2_12_FULL_62_27]|nr:MAG: hypothetical protein A3G34_09060 [Candidatus Lindowbacteria bacterium RIFCSPLOWO2_12_FULL_62_27]
MDPSDVAVTVSTGGAGAVVSAPWVVSTVPSRYGMKTIESAPVGAPLTIFLIFISSVVFHQLRVKVNLLAAAVEALYTPLSGLVCEVLILFF